MTTDRRTGGYQTFNSEHGFTLSEQKQFVCVGGSGGMCSQWLFGGRFGERDGGYHFR